MNELCKAFVTGLIEGAIEGAMVVVGTSLIIAGIGYLIGNK